jgi:hypothetical protein
MLESGCMKNNINAVHFSAQFIPISYICQEKAGMTVRYKPLLQKEQFAFIVIQRYDFRGMVAILKKLTDQFGPYSAASTRDQNSLSI